MSLEDEGLHIVKPKVRVRRKPYHPDLVFRRIGALKSYEYSAPQMYMENNYPRLCNESRTLFKILGEDCLGINSCSELEPFFESLRQLSHKADLLKQLSKRLTLDEKEEIRMLYQHVMREVPKLSYELMRYHHTMTLRGV